MLTEWVVDGGNTVDVNEWMAKLSELGITCEKDPKFDIHADEGFLRLRWQRGRSPAIDVGFDFCLGMPARDASPDLFAKVVSRYERMLANLRASKLPPSFADATAKKLDELRAPDRTQYVRIRVDSKDSRPGDYAAAAMCAAAYAALAGGWLDDREGGKRYAAKEAIAAMAKSKYMKMPGDDVVFTAWDAPAATKPAAKKPAAKKQPAKKPAKRR